MGTWEATPTLDEDQLQIAPIEDPAFSRASALGTRVIYRFLESGKLIKVECKRIGPFNGKVVDRMGSALTQGQWSLVGVDPKNPQAVRIRTSEQAKDGKLGKAVERTLAFDGQDRFKMESDIPGRLCFKSPFVFRRNVGERAMRWIAGNCVAGADAAKFTNDMQSAINRYLDNQEDFCLRLGSGLTRTNKAAAIYGFYEQFFAFELTPAQAASLKLGENDVQMVGVPHPDVFSSFSDLDIKDFKLVTAGALDPGRPVIVNFEADEVDPQGRVKFTYRLTCWTGETAFSTLAWSRAGGGISFKLPAKYAQYEGPMAVFVDSCRTTMFKNSEFTVEVLSNAGAMLVDARPGGGAKPK